MARPFDMRASLLVVLLLAPAVAAALPPLEQLETRVELSPAAQLAERAYESARDSLSAGRIGLGVSAFGNAGVGHVHEIIDPFRSWTYNQSQLSGGLSMPLLGSRLQLEDSLAERQVQLLQLDAHRQLEHRELVARLRKAYGEYWQAQRLQLLAQDYLQYQPAFEHLAERRTRAGLLLDADRLELLSGFSLARRDEASGGADQQVALGLLRELTGQDLDGGIAVRPLVPLACVRDLDASDTWSESDPELLGLQQVIALRASNPRDNVLYPVQSSVQLGIATVYDRPPGDRGGSAVLNWTFQVPIEYGSQRRLMARAAAAQLAHARLEFELRRQELRQQRTELIARAVVLEHGAEFAATRLAAADAAVDERGLRAVSLPGDVAEQLQRARLQRYNAAKAVVEADRAVLNWHADWARFEPSACEPAPVRTAPQLSGSADVTTGAAAQAQAGGPPTNATPEAAPAGERALYLWRSGEWLTEAASAAGADKFRELHGAGINRLLISLDAAQMHAALADPAPLAQAVRSTRAQGFSVELLLGDPGWIRPEGRGGLLTIIKGLKSVPFDGLHLDLEPEQLDAAPNKLAPLLRSLEQTLALAKGASPWPLALSIHPRDLDAEVGGGRFADVLLRLQVAPTLMVYVANPERAVAIAEPLLARHPQLSFSVALSLERSLGPQQSLWSYPQDERRRRIERVETRLAAANFAGLTLQLEDAWHDAAHLATLASGE